jgi:hypothetical protein
VLPAATRQRGNSTGLINEAALVATPPGTAPRAAGHEGMRDEAWRRQFNVGTLADCGVWLAPLAVVADDPDQDADGTDAAQIVRFAREVARRGRISR